MLRVDKSVHTGCEHRHPSVPEELNAYFPSRQELQAAEKSLEELRAANQQLSELVRVEEDWTKRPMFVDVSKVVVGSLTAKVTAFWPKASHVLSPYRYMLCSVALYFHAGSPLSVLTSNL